MGTVVTITSQEYARLQKRREQLDMLLTVLIRTASLNWSENGLSIDDKTADLFLSVICPEAWRDRLEDLKRENAEKEAADE